LLDGQAFFNVIHDAGRPFMVEAVGATAHDIGTAFDINIAPENVVVAVQSGTVGVFFGTAPAETLTAGERLTIDRATWHSVRTRKPIDSIAAWRAGRLVVDNLPVGEVVQYLRRYYNGYIWVHDPALNNRRISGVYNLNDPVSALRAVVEPHAGVVTTITPFLLVVTTR
jgi:transmembrane sensor